MEKIKEWTKIKLMLALNEEKVDMPRYDTTMKRGSVTALNPAGSPAGVKQPFQLLLSSLNLPLFTFHLRQQSRERHNSFLRNQLFGGSAVAGDG